jgi:flagellar assembly factor FliW
MPRIPTRFFAEVDYNPESVFHFTGGLPGFENESEFLFLNLPESEPVMFLQSVATRNLCFVLLPIRTLVPYFQPELSAEEMQALDLPAGRQPIIGEEVLCAALIGVGNEEVPFANLMAPIVVNLKNRCGIQVIHPESGYSHRHPIHLEQPAFTC